MTISEHIPEPSNPVGIDGIEFIVLTVALFGIGEVLVSCTIGSVGKIAEVRNVLPNRADWRVRPC